MSMRLAALFFLIGCPALLLGPHVRSGAPAPDGPGKGVGNFTLEDPRTGKTYSLADFKDRKAVVAVFLGTECPIGNAFLPVLADLHREYATRRVQFLGINANVQDTSAAVATHAHKHAIPFPVLKDVGNRVADRFGAGRTPEAFVLDGAGRVLYRGRIDDQFGIGYNRAGKPTRRDLAAALEEVLAGRPVSLRATKVAGCRIARARKPKAGGTITFARHVAPILQRNCQECHRPGQIGPMSLLTYEDTLAWSETIREVVSAGRMPPWHADPRYGHFANDRSLSKGDRATLLAWLDQGTPRGDDRDLPAPRTFVQGWTIGKPDVVFKMPRPFAVPAVAPEDGVPYKYFTIRPGFKEDRWVERAEARPDATAVVHHIVVFIVPRGEMFRPDGPGNVLCGTAPGDMPLVLEPGLAKKIPAGASLVLQMHYTPNGRPYKDQSSVGLIFAGKQPRHRVLTKPIHNRGFIQGFDSIPPGRDNYRMEASYTFPEGAHVVHFMPHMHLRGKDFLYEAVYPDGRREVLLSVPRYNFNWQSIYRPVRPVPLPKGTRLHCVAHFDNSANNPNNPDPTQEVSWGDQTWEEMMIGWIDYYLDGRTP